MDIQSVSRVLHASGLDLFSTRDLAVMFSPGDRALANLQVHQWARKGWIRRLKRGLFELALPEAAGISDLHIANRLYEPSYVSLDTAMSHHGLIPDVAMQVTSVTSGTTKRFVNLHGVFTYFSVTPGAFRGYCVIKVEGRQVLMAEPEKAVIDRLYAGMRRGEPFKPLVERWDRGRLKALSLKKMAEYAGLFGVNGLKLKERINALS